MEINKPEISLIVERRLMWQLCLVPELTQTYLNTGTIKWDFLAVWKIRLLQTDTEKTSMEVQAHCSESPQENN